MKRTLSIACASAGLLAVALAPAASASGSGNPYQDFQVGVTYTVYQPTFTAGLKVASVKGVTDAGSNSEENIFASYGTRKGGHFTVQEGNPMTTDIGQGALVATTKVQGRTAKVYAYCDPASSAKCTMADVAKVGGHLDVTLPAGSGLRKTRVWVESIQPHALSGAQLIAIAKGLKPVG